MRLSELLHRMVSISIHAKAKQSKLAKPVKLAKRVSFGWKGCELMNFIHEPNRIYLTNEDNQMIAEVTFPKVQEKIVNIDHTFVDPSLRGQGVAGKLMEETVSQLRQEQLKARLTCSYAVRWFEEHPECADVLEK